MQPFLRSGRTLMLWLLAGLLETGVATPWLIMLYAASGPKVEWPDALPGAWLLILAFMGSAAWEGGARNRDPDAQRNRRIAATLVGIGAVYVGAYLALPNSPGLFSLNLATSVIPVAGYICYQGIRTGAEGLEHGFVVGRFTTQSLLTVGGVVLLRLLGLASDPRISLLLYWSVLLLFTAGLLLLIATRERSLRADQAALGEKATGTSLSPLISGGVIALLLLTLGASQVLSVSRLAAVTAYVGKPFLAVYYWVIDVVMLLLYRWMQIFWMAFAPLFRWLAAHHMLPKPEQPPEQVDDPGKLPETVPNAGFLDSLLAYARFNGLVLIIILTVVAAVRLAGKVQSRRRDDVEERLSLGFWGSLLADLRALFGLIKPTWTPKAASTLPLTSTWSATDPRALFIRLQEWGASVGRPRRESETPSAYGKHLSGHRAEAAPAADAITSVYNQARYGAAPPAPAEVEAAARAAQDLGATSDQEQQKKRGSA